MPPKILRFIQKIEENSQSPTVGLFSPREDLVSHGSKWLNIDAAQVSCAKWNSSLIYLSCAWMHAPKYPTIYSENRRKFTESNGRAIFTTRGFGFPLKQVA